MPITLADHKRAARVLKKAFRAGEPAAIVRMRRIRRTPPQHADFLHVIALETGHESWPKLKFALETAELDRDARAERLRIALHYGQHWKVDRLLAADPGLGRHNLGLTIALYDLDTVKATLAADPVAATRPVGSRTPLLHLAFSQHFHAAPEKRTAMLAIADRLLAAGADPNESCPAAPESPHRLSALYGAIGHARNIPLAEKLLAAGATPDDEESLYHAAEAETNDGLRLLIRYRARTSGTNALPRALDFDDIEKARLLLTHAADPNEAVTGHPSGQPVDTIPALHQAARRWRGPAFATLLLDHGGDALDTTIHGAEFCPAAAKRDHLACARLILEAGVTIYDHHVAGCGREDLLSLLEDWREREEL